ncbi:MAG: hypothetical protein V4472_17900 [Pseudomonadota bacterium]
MLIVAFLAWSAAAPVGHAFPAPAEPVCQKVNLSHAALQSGTPSVHRLTDEPAARQVLAVLRTVDGCSRPVVVREDVGAPQR